MSIIKSKLFKSYLFILSIMLSFILISCKEEKGYLEIEVLNPQLTLNVSDTSQIEIKDKDNSKIYKYRSSDETVSVDETGLVKAEAIGSAIIFINVDDNEYGCCYVIVKNYKPIDIVSLEINNEIDSIDVGEEIEFDFIKIPSDADNYNSIFWKSSDETIATISDEGVLKALSPGEVIVSVVASGTEYKDAITININARASELALDYYNVFGVKDTNDLTISPILKTDYLNVEKGSWTTSDSNIVTVSEDGIVSFHNEGKAIITYNVKTPLENLTAQCNVTVGEKEGYTIIRTPEQLQEIGDVSGNYALGNDIDMEQACSKEGSLYHLGNGFIPLFSSPETAFSGTFDGQGYKIKNIMIKADSAFTALFRYINTNEGTEGVIKNLALVGGSISGTNFTSSFIGYISGGGSSNAGLKNCWTDVEIIASGSCGGLSGYNGGLIENCYSLSKITAGGDKASVSLFAKNGNSVIGVKNTYINSDIQSNIQDLVLPERIYESIMEAEYKTTNEMKKAELYTSWDKNIWYIVDGEYPQLITPND